MRESERKVGRADNNLEGAREGVSTSANADSTMNDPEHSTDSADQRTHGAHGKGRGDEHRQDETVPTPPFSKGSDRGGSDAWGNASSGGSTIDKRSPDK